MFLTNINKLFVLSFVILSSAKKDFASLETICKYDDYHRFLSDFYLKRKSKDTYFRLRHVGWRVGIGRALVLFKLA